MNEEPVRMHLDPELDAELRATLDAARADRVEAERIERLALRLGPLLGPPGGGGGGGGAPAKAAATTATAAKGGGVIAAAKGLALVAALGAAGTFVWIERGPSASETAHEAAETTERASAAALRPESTPTTEASPEPPSAPELSPPPWITPEASRAPQRSGPRVHTGHEEPQQRTAELAPTSTTSPTSAPPPTTAVTDAPTELSLVRGAMSALGSSPASALAQADEHARLYPRGALADDREVIAIDALVRLGRRGDAEERAGRFRTEHPGSPSIRRIERILAR